MIFNAFPGPDNLHITVAQELCSVGADPMVLQKTVLALFPIERAVVSEISCTAVCLEASRVSERMIETDVSREKDSNPDADAFRAMQAVVDRGILHSLCAGCENLETP